MNIVIMVTESFYLFIFSVEREPVFIYILLYIEGLKNFNILKFVEENINC